MKRTKLLLIPSLLCLVGLTSCRSLFNLFRNLDEDEESEEQNNEENGSGTLTNDLSAILKKINDRNYYLDFTGLTTISMSFTYHVDGGYVYLPDSQDYYDYTNSNTTNSYEYYEFDEGAYFHGTESLAGEPGYSRLITRARLSTSDFKKTAVDNEYAMVDSTLADFDLSSLKMKYKTENSKPVISFAGETVTNDTYGSIVFTAKFYNFGGAHVNLPTNYIDE